MDHGQGDNVANMPRNRGLSNAARLALCCGLAVIALGGWNALVALPVQSALAGEDSHRTFAYRRWLLSPNQIVLDVWSVSGEARMVDMDRQLFKAAKALRKNAYSSVILAYRGKEKLVMEGAYFQTIGKEYGVQNPLYVMREMQEHIANPDGTPAFGEWRGGWLAVMGKQLEDHNEFHARWWLRDAARLEDGQALRFQ